MKHMMPRHNAYLQLKLVMGLEAQQGMAWKPLGLKTDVQHSVMYMMQSESHCIWSSPGCFHRLESKAFRLFYFDWQSFQHAVDL